MISKDGYSIINRYLIINFYNVFWIYWLIGMSEMIVDYWLLEYDDNDNSLLKVTKINNNNILIITINILIV